MPAQRITRIGHKYFGVQSTLASERLTISLEIMTKWKQISRLLLLSAGCLTAFPVTCNSIFAKRHLDADDGYEYVKVSGSMLPQRVKKGAAVVTTSPTDAVSKEAFEQMRQKLQSVGKLPGAQ